MTNEEKKFIQSHYKSGKTEFFGEIVPWVAVPNMPGRAESFTLEEIREALRESKESQERERDWKNDSNH